VLPTVVTLLPGDQGGPPGGPGQEEGANVLPEVVAAAPESQPAAQTLPFTGSNNPMPLVIAAGLMIATGGGVLLTTRRRSRA
jgi:LPXTG-motif cell wall-anchored protein